MSKKIRKAGIHIIGDISWGTHFCQFYKTKKDLIDILVPYFKAGLENNEYCMWVTSKPLTEKDAAKALAKALPDLDSYLKKGQIEIIPHDKWYLKNGIFNSKRVNKGWLRKLDKALANGYDGLRFSGNTFWVKKKDWNIFTNYEKEADSLIGEYNIIALCTYSLDKCRANEVIDVVRNHQSVLIKREGKWEIIESSERKRAEDEIKRFASFPQLSPNPVLEVNSSGIIVFSNAAAVLALRKLDLRDANVFLPDDITHILTALEQENEAQFYREVKIKDRIFGEVLCLTPQFDSIRIYANDITERKSYREAIEKALYESRHHDKEMLALSNAARATLKYPDFKSAAREIFDYCRQLIGATSGYIALLNKNGTENEVLFLDSGGLPCSVDPELPMPVRGFRAEAYHGMKTVYHNDFLNSDWMKFIPNGHVKLRNVLFAPLITDGKTVGLLGLANKTGGFTDNDARIASAFSDLAAIALTQKSAEEALRHSEEFYRIVTENTSDITTILDANGTIQYESLSIEQVLGYKQEELIGKSAFELIHPDDLPNVMDTFSQGLQNPGVTLNAEFRFRHKDGSWRILSIAGKNLLDNSAIRAIVVNSRDVTEQNQAEKALRSERQRLINILDSMVDGVYIVDQHNDIEYLNPLLEEEYGPVNGRKCHEYFEGRKKACTWCKNQEVFKGNTVRWEWFSEKTNKTYDLINTPLRNPDGSVSKLGIFRDITERKQAEDALRKSEERLQLQIDRMPIGRIVWDPEFRVLSWNPAAEEIFGFKSVEVLGKHPYGLIVPTKAEPHVDTIWHRLLQGDTTAHSVNENITKDGRTIFCSWSNTPLKDTDGSVTGVLSMVENITERKQAEEALRRSREDLDRAQAVGNIGSWRMDVQRNELTWSDENHQIFGIPKGTPMTYETFLSVVHPDDREYVDTKWKAGLAGEDYDIEHRIVVDGKIKWVREKAYLEFDKNSALLGGFGITQNITDRKRMEEELRRSRDELEIRVQERTAQLHESEKRYRVLVETMNEGLGMDDENGLLVYANERFCEMLGYSQEEIIGRPVLSFFDKKNQSILKEQIEKRKEGENEPYRIEWTGKDNKKIITLLSPKGIFDENGNYRGSFAVITDITEKLKLESIAEAVNTMENIGFVFSGVRHEIGNPVNSIKMALSVLKQNIDSYSIDKIKEYADRMLEEISRMEYLLKAMKNFNMYETVELIDMNMTDFMDKFFSLVKGDFEKRGIMVETSISEPAWVYADPRALQQALLNIMTNAADALEGRQDSRITINVLKMADMVNIRIEDNGCGMSEQQQDDLFKPFYTGKVKGTGLGLVITKKMMAKMKGFIEVVSEKDKGTIVDLFIPEGISE